MVNMIVILFCYTDAYAKSIQGPMLLNFFVDFHTQLDCLLDYAEKAEKAALADQTVNYKYF
jgi:hypothetical protein